VTTEQPRIAFCTTCKGRTQHLEQTLPRNLYDNRDYPNAVFVVLDYNSQDHLLRYLAIHHKHSIESGRLVVYSLRENTPFRMAHAKNMAHRLGILEGADILVNLDADNYTHHGFAHYVAGKFREAKQRIFLWARMIKEGADRMARGCSGRIVVTKQAFLIAGGYDEKFHTWSPDDKDFNARLRRLGFEAVEIERRYLDAVLHNDKMRFREYRHARDCDYDFDEAGTGDNTIANFGKVGCGIVHRNFDSSPIELQPIPTRIFGIGMHKTATTSLHTALTILGYDSAHWKTAHWAKAIWREMLEQGRSQTLEKHYALCDLPIPILFRQLDNVYPGSKFILTVRDEKRWLRSVRNHWSPEHNPYRRAWNTDPFTHKIHREVYGQKGFDPGVFLARYRQHNHEVLEYFRDRPQDLLVMNMSEGAGWRELCGFLGVPVPSARYPLEFATHEFEGHGAGI
jgi:hypothetical protein